MIITEKNEVFQKLLKDVENLKARVETQKKYGDCAIKEGTWVRDDYHNRPFKFGRTEGLRLVWDMDGVLRDEVFVNLKIMSPEEIKEYLMEEARKKGFLGWMKFKWDDEQDISKIIVGHGYEYVSSVDALTVAVDDSKYRRAIYMDGKWATLVFDTELPQTVSELKGLLKDFCKSVFQKEVDFYSLAVPADLNESAIKFLKEKGFDI